MRKTLLLLWLMIPVLFGAYHYGPGQDRMQLDDAADYLARAYQHATAERWLDAVSDYDEALELLPSEEIHSIRRARLERAKSQMMVKKLPEAHRDLEQLATEMRDDANADRALLDEVRAAHANSQYYMTWLMRLEGEPKERCEPEIEAARQTYRLLAESAETTGKAELTSRYKKDLESVIRLARMELTELQGLPLPSQ